MGPTSAAGGPGGFSNGSNGEHHGRVGGRVDRSSASSGDGAALFRTARFILNNSVLVFHSGTISAYNIIPPGKKSPLLSNVAVIRMSVARLPCPSGGVECYAQTYMTSPSETLPSPGIGVQFSVPAELDGPSKRWSGFYAKTLNAAGDGFFYKRLYSSAQEWAGGGSPSYVVTK